MTPLIIIRGPLFIRNICVILVETEHETCVFRVGVHVSSSFGHDEGLASRNSHWPVTIRHGNESQVASRLSRSASNRLSKGITRSPVQTRTGLWNIISRMSWSVDMWIALSISCVCVWGLACVGLAGNFLWPAIAVYSSWCLVQAGADTAFPGGRRASPAVPQCIHFLGVVYLWSV